MAEAGPGPGLSSTEAREVLREEPRVEVEEVETLELAVEPVVEDEGEEEQPGTSLTNTNLSVAVKQLKDERYRLFHSLNVKELNFEKLLFFVSCGIFWKKKVKRKN